jgi:hypothetical protein
VGSGSEVDFSSSSNVANSSPIALMAGFIDPDAKTRHGLRAHTVIAEKRKIKVSNRLIDSNLLLLIIVVSFNLKTAVSQLNWNRQQARNA